MTCEVRVSEALAVEIAAFFGPARSARGAPSELDFWSGPLHAALLGFRDFESLAYDDVPQVRRLEVVDVILGPVVFIGVLVAPGIVELAAFDHDPDYWELIEGDPDD